MRTVQSDLQQNVIAELRWDPSVDSSRIGVAIEKGVVALTGKVPSLHDRRAAEAAVKRVRGVTTVANELEVEIAALHQRDDIDIARASKDALRWHVSVPDERLKVAVTKGWVTLEGTVEHGHQRAAAESCVAVLTGVRGVTNRIVVKPPVAATDVRRQLATALHRYAQLEADAVSIGVQGDAITLTGAVNSWAERDELQAAAWRVPGVAHVDNQLSVKLS